MIAKIYKNIRNFINDLVLYRGFCVLKLINGVIDLTTVHDTLGIVGFGFDKVIKAELKNPGLARLEVLDFLQDLVVNFPSVVDLAAL